MAKVQWSTKKKSVHSSTVPAAWEKLAKLSFADRGALFNKRKKVKIVSAGSFGVVLSAPFFGGTLAIKVYKNTDDWELQLFGIEEDGSLDAATCAGMERIVSQCGLTMTTMVRCSQACGVCRNGSVNSDAECRSACLAALGQKIHFHAVMPLMDGTAESLVKGPRASPLYRRIYYASKIVVDLECLRGHGFVFTDMKVKNILIKRSLQQEGRAMVHLADLGSLCHVARRPTTKRDGADKVVYLRRWTDNTGRFSSLDAVDPRDSPADLAADGIVEYWPHTVTYVNIFLRVYYTDGKPANKLKDFAQCSHIGGQFSIVVLLLQMIRVNPPRWRLAKNAEATREKYNNSVIEYICKEYYGPERQWKSIRPLVWLVTRIWSACNIMRYYSCAAPYNAGTKENYIRNIHKSLKKVYLEVKPDGGPI